MIVLTGSQEIATIAITDIQAVLLEFDKFSWFEFSNFYTYCTVVQVQSLEPSGKVSFRPNRKVFPKSLSLTRHYRAYRVSRYPKKGVFLQNLNFYSRSAPFIPISKMKCRQWDLLRSAFRIIFTLPLILLKYDIFPIGSGPELPGRFLEYDETLL